MLKKENENLKKFLKETISLIVGKQAENIIDFLDNEKYINEFLIAKRLDITINQTRNILYKLSDHGLVSSIRKKDKKKGWYTYFWKLEILRSLNFYKNFLKKRVDQISPQIDSRELKTFYVCETCNIEYNEENALLYDFKCNECGSIFTVKDNSKVLRELKKNLDKQNKELEFLEEEISQERDRVDKKKLKEIKKEEQEKIRKRLEKRKLTQKKFKKLIKKVPMKEAKKDVKKISPKKVSKKVKTVKSSKKIAKKTVKKTKKEIAIKKIKTRKKK